MDLWVREARLFKYGSGTGSNFSQRARRRRAAVGRRQVVGPDVVPQDRRSRGGRHQVGRHDAARRQDGRRSTSTIPTSRSSSPGRCSRSRRSPRWSPARGSPTGTSTPSCGLPRGDEGDALRPEEEPAAAPRDRRRPPGRAAGELHPARHPVRPPGLSPHRIPGLRHRLAVGSLCHGRRARTPTTRCASPTPSCSAVEADREWALTERTTGKVAKTVSARGAVGPRRRGGLALGRSRRAVRHHHQRLAHLPGVGPHQRLEPVLGVHVPRRHGVQSGVAEPDAVPPGRRLARCRRRWSMRPACGPSCSRSR